MSSGSTIDEILRDLGIDDTEIARRMDFLKLADRDRKRLAAFHRMIEEGGECAFFVEAFYRHLMMFPETARFIEDPVVLARLKKTQADYFHTLTSGYYGPAYIRNRVRVGVAHERVGLAPKWYLGAYNMYVTQLVPRLQEYFDRDSVAYAETLQALIKIILFDMGLAIDTYIHAGQRATRIKTSQLEALNRVAMLLTSSTDIKEGLQQVATLGQELTGAAVALVRYARGAPQEWFLSGISPVQAQDAAFAAEGPADEALATGYAVRCSDSVGGSHALTAAAREAGVRCCLCLPLISHDVRLGVLALFRKDRDSFTNDEIGLLTTCASLAAGAIENAKLHGELLGQAITDPLTGLPNRRYLDERLNSELGRARRYDKPFTLLMLDIDHFKAINDTHGHAAGDAVLRRLAEVLLAQLREVDFVARYGGEEFILILPETGREGGRLVAERICGAITAAPFRLPDGQTLGVTASIGAVTYPQGGAGAAELLEHGDAALYAAKLAGRNRVVAYGDMTGSHK